MQETPPVSQPPEPASGLPRLFRCLLWPGPLREYGAGDADWEGRQSPRDRHGRAGKARRAGGRFDVLGGRPAGPRFSPVAGPERPPSGPGPLAIPATELAYLGIDERALLIHDEAL